jgi:hypothetical protein
MVKKLCFAFLIVSQLVTTALASNPVGKGSVEEAGNRVFQREAANMKTFGKYAPMVETYLQTFQPDKELGQIPSSDHYFLGRVSFKGEIHDDQFFWDPPRKKQRLFSTLSDFAVRHHPGWRPVGFARMAIIDPHFDRDHYSLTFRRREFVGVTRCLVFDVVPKAKRSGPGRFEGRIWVEEAGYNIVRFNGTYLNPKAHTVYLHCDSWRVKGAPALWLPGFIYSEETTFPIERHATALKAQTRIWGYRDSEVMANHQQSEFTAVFVDPKDAVSNSLTGAFSPVASQRAWQRQAEDNVIERLTRGELLSPPSDVDKMIEQVVTNLEASSNITVDPEVRCRLLLTTPLESFTVGHTIFISRGLLDVLPDEASLAAVLARELAHIVLSHDSSTKFAYSDRLLFADRETLLRLGVKRQTGEEVDADKKALELLQATSLYKDKLASIGLFMKELTAAESSLPHLTHGRLGESFVTTGAASRLTAAIAGIPELKKTDPQQIAALPLGSRIVVDPYTASVAMRNVSVQLLNAREKMPFEVTPFFPQITTDQLPSGNPDSEPAATTEQPQTSGGSR